MEILEYIEMSEEELNSFFNKYSARELELFRQLYEFVFKQDLSETKKEFDKVYDEKIRDASYEERMKMNDILKVSSLNKKNHSLTDKELNFFYNLVDEASICAEITDFDEQISEFTKLHDNVYSEIENRLSKTIPPMTKEELELFFNKYDLYELELFGMIFNSVKDYDISDALNVSRKVYNKKCDELGPKEYELYRLGARHICGDVSDIMKKNEKLTLKELEYLKALVKNTKQKDSTDEKKLELKTTK